MIKRANLQVLKKRIEEPRKFIQVLLDPRQVGKTTLISQLLSEISISYQDEPADAVAANNTGWLAQVWQAARLRMKALQEIPSR